MPDRFISGLRDLHQAGRSLARTPWYSLAVIAVSALSVSLATTVFAIVDGVLFKPLPYPHIEALYEATGPGGRALSKRDVRQWGVALPGIAIAAYQHVFDIGSLAADRPAALRASRVNPVDALRVD